MYEPKPIDTSGVQLPDELLDLVEKIAENTHDVWAAGRIAEGWRYGSQRSDVEKLTPCLVPYDQLPEAEKAYDRNTALAAIKLTVKFGFQIRKKEE